MLRQNEYTKRKLLHGWISEKILIFLGSLPKFQGGLIKLLQTYYKHWAKKRFDNGLPQGSNLNLEFFIFPVLLTHTEWLEKQKYIGRFLIRNRARGFLRIKDDKKIWETINSVNNSTVHNRMWAKMGLTTFSKTNKRLHSNVKLIDVDLFALSKGHVLILFSAFLNEDRQKELQKEYYRHFHMKIYLVLTFLKNIFKYWGMRSESGTLFKEYFLRKKLNKIKREVQKEVFKELKIKKPMIQSDAGLDFYTLQSADPKIWDYEFWYTIKHGSNSSGFFVNNSNNWDYTISIPGGDEDKSIKVVAHLDKIADPEPKGLHKKDKAIDDLQYYINDLMITWIYHSTYWSKSNEIGHRRFVIEGKPKLSLFRYLKEKRELLADGFSIDMFSKDVDIDYYLNEIKGSSKVFVENFELQRGNTLPIGQYLEDGITFFKKVYLKSRKELIDYIETVTDLKYAKNNIILQISLLLLTIILLFSVDWSNVSDFFNLCSKAFQELISKLSKILSKIM